MGMVDVSDKSVISREAEAAGVIVLSPETIERIRQGEIKKGDPLVVAEVAGMNAAKQTHLLIPHCHQIPLEAVRVSFELFDRHVEVRGHVRAHAKTGVEMEALVAVSLALCTIWDMVKYLEKDTGGQYPTTRIQDIRVVRKVKGHA
jgi:cyclic pyranopterin phosphate synthase